MSSVTPPLARGQVWLVDLDPVPGQEQARRHPVLIVSVDAFNFSRADLVIVAPITSTIRPLPLHVTILPAESGLTNASSIHCENLRALSKQRFLRLWGQASHATLSAVEERLRILLNL